MEYRIRYRRGTAQANEMVVEANSPAEAMIKFQHTHSVQEDFRNPSRVVSVLAEPRTDQAGW